MNLAELVAIDVYLALPPRLVEAASQHMACVIFTVDAESATGHPLRLADGSPADA